MLKNLGHILALLALVSVPTSCLKWEEWDDETESEVTFNILDTDMQETKAVVDFVGTFRSYAWFLPKDHSWDDADKAAYAELYLNGPVIQKVGDVWKDPDSHYWWPKLGSLTFVSVTPTTVPFEVSMAKVTLNSWDVKANPTADLMVSNVAKDKRANATTYNTEGVPTLFSHILSKVDFGFTFSVPDGTTITVTDVTLDNIFHKGSYDSALSTPWTVVTEGTSYSFTPTVNAETSAVTTQAMLMMPQTLRNNGETVQKLTVSYTVNISMTDVAGEVVTINTPYTRTVNLYSSTLDKWYPGTHIRYNVQISATNNPIRFSVDWNEWSAGTSLEINQ